ncbi:MAG: hypothetical protein Ct9H300mP21_11340 [Pseudomonadota bacterium]|nr:MAG: hypothetical protein Ct9H300mP21_11340 [Pseudomonadota bacterium]
MRVRARTVQRFKGDALFSKHMEEPGNAKWLYGVNFFCFCSDDGDIREGHFRPLNCSRI